MLEPSFRVRKYRCNMSAPNDERVAKKILLSTNNTTPINFEVAVAKFIEHLRSLDCIDSDHDVRGRVALSLLKEDSNKGRRISDQVIVLDSDDDSSSSSPSMEDSDSSDEERPSRPKKMKADSANLTEKHQSLIRRVERRLRLYILNDPSVSVRMIQNRLPPPIPAKSLSEKKKWLKKIFRAYGCHSSIYKDWIVSL